jgi:hypothetical protein
MLFVYSLLASAAGTQVVTDAVCSTKNGHPENGGYYVTGFGFKDEFAHEDPDDDSTYGEWGVMADDTEWTTGKGYPAAFPVTRPCTPYPDYGMFCDAITDHYVFLMKSTCAIMRFSFSDSSTVYLMSGNASFQKCDFEGAEELTDGGSFSDGTKYIDFPLEQDMIDNQYYIASKIGCEDGQKVAIAVINEYGATYQDCYDMGAETNRIQHCDCDHSIKKGTLNEVCGTGFIDGCRDQYPDDMGCCPGDDVEYVKVGRGGNYVKGGSCIPKNKQNAKMQLAKDVFELCTDSSNKERCDGYRTGACPWYRVYNAGNWVYNTKDDGTEGCDCTADSKGMVGMETHAQCTDKEGGCETCMDMLAYGGDGKKMPQDDKYMGCDGDTSTYDAFCNPWYMISHCLDIADGKELGAGFTGDALAKIKAEINADECDASQDVAAYKMYANDPQKWKDWLDGVVPLTAVSGTTVSGESFAVLSAMGLMFALQA